MNQLLTNERLGQSSSRLHSRLTYTYYLLTIAIGVFVFFAGNRLNFLVDVIATAFFVAATVLFYAITKDHRRSASGE